MQPPQEVPTPETPNTQSISPISKMASLCPGETPQQAVAREHDNQQSSPSFPAMSPPVTADEETQAAETVPSSAPLTPTEREEATLVGETDTAAVEQTPPPGPVNPIAEPRITREPAPGLDSSPQPVLGDGQNTVHPEDVPVTPKTQQSKGSKLAVRPRLRPKPSPKVAAPKPQTQAGTQGDIYEGGLYWKSSSCIVCPCSLRISHVQGFCFEFRG